MYRHLVPTLLSFGLGFTLSAASLEDDFRQPPAVAKPYVWWHWMGANISKEGITKDLEAMKAAGIGGATIFNITSGVRESQVPILDLPWPDRTYRSPYYWECLRHAAAEAKRLGLEVGLHNTVGYSTTGGPWVTEPESMKKVMWTETAVTGGAAVKLSLPQPAFALQGGWGGVHRDPPTFYRDIAVIAVPVSSDPVAPERLLDLSAKVDASGTLTWSDAPAGAWTVVRLGYGPTGSTPHPVPDEVIGRVREADKMDPAVTTTHWNTVLNPLKEHLGEYLGDSFRHVLIDSYEAGNQNWTDGFRADFQARFGYDPAPWLVARTPKKGSKDPSRIIGSEELTGRFEVDFKTLVAERYQRDGWEMGQKLIRDARLTLQQEAYGGPFDTVAGSYSADLPMGEFWSNSGGGISGGIVAGGRAGGHRVIGAEAFTGQPKVSAFNETLGMLLKGTLGTFAGGVNRLILHHWVHQPFGDQFVPGQGMGWWGTHFSRHQTWFEGGRAWLSFAGRCQVLLQHGETPVSVLAIGRAVGTSDAVPVQAFLTGATVEGGDVVLPSGRRYAVLALPSDRAVAPEILRKLKRLNEAGATLVLGDVPERSPSLQGYPACDQEVRTLAAELWRADRPRVFRDVSAALADRKVVEPATLLRGKVHTVVRHAADADLVYLANMEDAPQAATLSLAGDQRQPEVWNPEDGTIAPAPVWRSAASRTEVDLTLPALSARFVVLRTSGSAPRAESVTITGADAVIVPTPAGPVLRTEGPTTAVVVQRGVSTTVSVSPVAPPIPVGGDWKVAFTGPGTSGSTITLPNLMSWTDHTDPAVRYASGTGTYTTHFGISSQFLSNRGRIVLDLGAVRDVAQVSCNGVPVATLWRAPYRADLTEALNVGMNVLSIAVSNTWYNRLVGDEQEPEDCEWGPVKSMGGAVVGRGLVRFPAWFREGKPRPAAGRRCFVTWNYVTKTSPLLPAGLLGPVRLIPVAEIALVK